MEALKLQAIPATKMLTSEPEGVSTQGLWRQRHHPPLRLKGRSVIRINLHHLLWCRRNNVNADEGYSHPTIGRALRKCHYNGFGNRHPRPQRGNAVEPSSLPIVRRTPQVNQGDARLPSSCPKPTPVATGNKNGPWPTGSGPAVFDTVRVLIVSLGLGALNLELALRGVRLFRQLVHHFEELL
jgi:hypothetical protein